MTRVQIGPLAVFLRSMRAYDGADTTDSQLLEKFVGHADEDAFARLVKRHGPLVASVCRRVLGDDHDVDDAFQATFLVLIRMARKIRKRESLASWLHGVAYRVATKAKVRTAIRSARERPLSDRAGEEADPELVWRDMRPVLDAELNRLPEKCRAPFVLCYLQGKTNEEAARILKCPPGTIFSRLAAAREKLCSRLTQRGLAFSLAALDLLTTQQNADAAISAQLIESTCKTATAAAASNSTAITTLSKSAISLADGIGRVMLLARVSSTAIVAFAVALLGIGTGLMIQSSRPADSVTETPAEITAQPALAKKPQDKKVEAAIAKGIEFLKRSQVEGTWEKGSPPICRGGFTALAVLALLEAGVKADDPTLAQALQYLRNLEFDYNYVISLQTVVLCRATPVKDKALIQRNVETLLKHRVVQGGSLHGWTYNAPIGKSRSDNSNSHYVVMALDAAQDAGAQIDKSVWRQIADFYRRSQNDDGGWCYLPLQKTDSVLTMTSAGVCGLAICRKNLKENDNDIEKALEKGLNLLGQNFKVEQTANTFYLLESLSRAGRLTGKQLFVGKELAERHDWYKEGTEMLIVGQNPDGSWKSKVGNQDSIRDTSFALMFLARGN